MAIAFKVHIKKRVRCLHAADAGNILGQAPNSNVTFIKVTQRENNLINAVRTNTILTYQVLRSNSTCEKSL